MLSSNILSIAAIVGSLVLMFSGIPEIYDLEWYYYTVHNLLCNNLFVPSTVLRFLPIPSRKYNVDTTGENVRRSVRPQTTIPNLLPFLVMLIDNYIGLIFSYRIHDTLGLRLRLLGTGLNIMYLFTLMYRILLLPSTTSTIGRRSTTIHNNDTDMDTVKNNPIILFIITHIVAGILLYSVHDKIDILGIVNTLTSIGFAISPLTSLPVILRTQNTDALSFSMTVALEFCAVSWMIRGIQLQQIWMIFPNALNAVIAACQLFLMYRYRRTTTGTVTTSDSESSSSPFVPSSSAQVRSTVTQSTAEASGSTGSLASPNNSSNRKISSSSSTDTVSMRSSSTDFFPKRKRYEGDTDIDSLEKRY